jgi:serine/threonine-protein kinase
VVAGLGALALIGGIAAFAAMRRGPDPAPVAASTTPAPSAPEPLEKPRAVKLVVLPDDVKVQVDGAPVTPKDGVVEIRGTLGSEHRVRLYRLGPDGKTDAELEKDVAITETGASPAKLDLPAIAPPASASATAAASAPKRPGPLPKPVLRNDR